MTTNSKDLALRVRTLANYGAPQKYHHEYLGLNSRLDELQSALLDIRLSHLEADNQRRREIAAMYSQGIKIPSLKSPTEATPLPAFSISIRCVRPTVMPWRATCSTTASKPLFITH